MRQKVRRVAMRDGKIGYRTNCNAYNTLFRMH